MVVQAAHEARVVTGTAAYTFGMADRIKAVLSGLVQTGKPYALLDWPNYDNIGDSAIWLGAREVLEGLTGRPPSFVSRGATYPDHLERALPEGPVFLLGGGNFGDIYESYQENRHRILGSLRHRKIVQLPQSLHFSDSAAIDKTARAISGHPDFTLLVRDAESLDLARAKFDCATMMCPDLAFGMGPITSQSRPGVDVFGLMRDDVERVDRAGFLSSIDRPVLVEDWNVGSRQLRSGLSYSLSRRSAVWTGLAMPWITKRFDRIARLRMDQGIRQLAQGRIAVTDRLHGHVLCTMMGKRHLVFDNTYGKIARYRAAWPGDDLAVAAEDAADARRKIDALLAE